MIELKSNFTQHGILDMEKLVHNVQPIEEGNNLTYFDGSWKQISQLNFLKKRIDMRSQRVGTFFIKAFHDNVHLRYKWGKDLDEIFKLPNEEVSLMNIVQLYSTLNSDVLSKEYYEKFRGEMDNLALIESIPEFVSCFDAVYETKESFVASIGLYDDTILRAIDQVEVTLPCEKEHFVSKCEKYCNWHGNFFNGGHEEKFLTLMKYSIPQPKTLFII